MANLNFDFSIDTDISLDKMYTNAKKIGKLNVTSTNADINPNYSVQSANVYGGVSSNQTETIDLSLDNLTNANTNLQSNNFNLNNNTLKENNNISNNTLNFQNNNGINNINTNYQNNNNINNISQSTLTSNNVNNMSSSLNNNFQNQTTMGSSSNGIRANVSNQFGNYNGGSNVSFNASQNSNLQTNINSSQSIGINGQNNFSGNLNTSSFNSAINSQSSMKNESYNLGANLNVKVNNETNTGTLLSTILNEYVDVTNLNRQLELEQADIFFDVMGRTGASVVNTVVSFSEGLLKFGESIFDCACVVGGAILSFGGLLGGASIEDVRSFWKDFILPGVAKNHVSGWYDKLYSTSYMIDIDDLAYDAFSRTSSDGGKGIFYQTFEGVGYYSGIIATTILTGGASSMAGVTISKSAIQATVMGVSSMGKYSQSSFKNLLKKAEEENREVKDSEILKSLSLSALKAAVDGGIYYTAGKAKDMIKIMANEVGGSFSLFFSKNINYFANSASTIVKSFKPLISEMISFVSGDGFSGRNVLVGTFSTIIAETLANGTGNILKKIDEKILFNDVGDARIGGLVKNSNESVRSSWNSLFSKNTLFDLTKRDVKEFVKNFGNKFEE